MQEVIRWATFDGHESDSCDEAIRYLEEMRGSLIERLAHRIVAADFKFSAVVNVLDAELDELAQRLVQINDDHCMES